MVPSPVFAQYILPPDTSRAMPDGPLCPVTSVSMVGGLPSVARMMKEGSVTNIADTAGVHPWPGYLAYGASKAGLVGLTRGLAKALAPKIRVNAVLPGPMLAPEGEGEMETLKAAASKTLLKRPGSPEDIAAAVRFLVTSPYVTAALLPVDGCRLAAGE